MNKTLFIFAYNDFGFGLRQEVKVDICGNELVKTVNATQIVLNLVYQTRSNGVRHKLNYKDWMALFYSSDINCPISSAELVID